MPILKEELTEFMQEYNAYNVRKQKDRLCPPGIPEDNFRFPERLGEGLDGYIVSHDCSISVTDSRENSKNLAWNVRKKYCLSFQNTLNFSRFKNLPLKYQNAYS